jgi:hypothetical protein
MHLVPLKECRASCPFNAFRAHPQFGKEYGLCLKPDHFQELETAAKAKERARYEKEQAAAAAKVQAALKQAGESGIPELKSLNGGTYENLSYGPRPAGCTKACPCFGQGKDWQGRIVPVCFDPKRLQKLKAAQTKSQTAARKERFAGVIAELERMPEDSRDPRFHRSLAMLCWDRIRQAKMEVRRAVAKEMREAYPTVAALLDGKNSYETEREGGYPILMELPHLAMIGLAAEVVARDEIREAVEYRKDELPRTDWILGKTKGKKDKPAAAPAEQPTVTSAEGDHPGERPDLVACQECGSDIAPDDAVDRGGRRLCPECAEDPACVDCGAEVRKDPNGFFPAPEGGLRCGTCQEKRDPTAAESETEEAVHAPA